MCVWTGLVWAPVELPFVSGASPASRRWPSSPHRRVIDHNPGHT